MSFNNKNCDFNFTVTNIRFVIHRKSGEKKAVGSVKSDNNLIVFAKSGHCTYKTGGKEYDVQKGDLLFFQKKQAHSAVANDKDPWSYYTVSFDIDCLSEETKQNILKLPLITKTKHFSLYYEKFSELLSIWSTRDTGYLLKCRSLISDILYMMIRENTESPVQNPYADKLDALKLHIAKNYTKTFSINELAEITGISPSYFRMLFKKHTGYSAIQYQNRIKINKACDMLKSRTFNITEIAYAVGYSDVYYFSRIFKKTMGISPSEYIKNGFSDYRKSRPAASR